MKTIELTQGFKATVDDDDFDRLSSVKWCYSDGYAVRNVRMPDGSRETIRMHWEVIGRPEVGFETDHKNGNGIDNRRENLRNCTHAQNNKNAAMHKNNRSGVKGVCWKKENRKWMASIMSNRKLFYLGLFESKEAAGKAYNDAAVRLHGQYARTSALSDQQISGL